ncbi:MAG: TfoX/Sxy family protein [Bacteroidia bacterium]|nr:TfoX/Sxy family protein [Bacteroidia bacterium]
MGLKGDKNTEESNRVAALIETKLAETAGITLKKMFGGHGIFHDNKMFGLVDSKGNTFLKANEKTLSQFKEFGTEQHSRMPYYSVPDVVIEEDSRFQNLVDQAIEISK